MTIKRLAMALVQGLIVLVFLALFMIVLVEWMSGCGEAYVDSKGVSHQQKCFFIK